MVEGNKVLTCYNMGEHIKNRKEAASVDMYDSVYKVSRASKSIETERSALWDRRKWGDTDFF